MPDSPAPEQLRALEERVDHALSARPTVRSAGLHVLERASDLVEAGFSIAGICAGDALRSGLQILVPPRLDGQTWQAVTTITFPPFPLWQPQFTNVATITLNTVAP